MPPPLSPAPPCWKTKHFAPGRAELGQSLEGAAFFSPRYPGLGDNALCQTGEQAAAISHRSGLNDQFLWLTAAIRAGVP